MKIKSRIKFVDSEPPFAKRIITVMKFHRLRFRFFFPLSVRILICPLLRRVHANTRPDALLWEFSFEHSLAENGKTGTCGPRRKSPDRARAAVRRNVVVAKERLCHSVSAPAVECRAHSPFRPLVFVVWKPSAYSQDFPKERAAKYRSNALVKHDYRFKFQKFSPEAPRLPVLRTTLGKSFFRYSVKNAIKTLLYLVLNSIKRVSVRLICTTLTFIIFYV